MTRLSGCSTLFTSLMPTLSSVTYRRFHQSFFMTKSGMLQLNTGWQQQREPTPSSCRLEMQIKALKDAKMLSQSLMIFFCGVLTIIHSHLIQCWYKKKLSVALMISLFGNTSFGLSGALLVFMLCYLLTNACNTILPNHNCSTTSKSFHTKNLCYTINTASV